MSYIRQYIIHLILFITGLFITNNIFAGNCINRNDSLVLSTQQEVDMFPFNFPGCTSITGKLIISGNNINNLQALSALTYVGSLNIRDNPNITNLSGLHNIKTAGYIDISHNESLLSLNGLESLDSVSTSLEVKYNNSLITLDGINSLRTVNNTLSVFSNSTLLSLDGLESIASISKLSIYGNYSLSSLLGIDSMLKVKIIDIWVNESLTCCDLVNKIRKNNPFVNLTNVFNNNTGCNSAADIERSEGTDNCCKTEFSVSVKKICAGESITVGTNTYTLPGIYIDTLRTVSNCDSILYTDLSFGKPSYTIVNREFCSGQSFRLSNGSIVNSSGIYKDTIPFTCDSVVEYRLIFLDAVRAFEQRAACEGKSFTLPGGRVIYEPGIYIDTVRNVGFCDSIYTTTVTFFPNSFSVSLPAEVIINIGDSLELIPRYSNGVPLVWTWSPNNDLSCTNCENPKAAPYENAVYEVRVQSANGCEGNAKINVLVKETDIYIPTAFSPNGDNVNDELNVFMSLPKVYSLKIFNRFGELVFFSDSLNSKWNGTFKNENCPSDSYLYIINAVLFNGRNLQKKGTVTLLR